MKHIQDFESFLNESENFKDMKRGDKITISSEVSNRPLGGYAIFWEYTNGRIGYKTAGSKSISYVSPEYVEKR